MVAVGPLAETLTEPHELGHALGEGSPVERFVRLGGKALLLGAPLNSVSRIALRRGGCGYPQQTMGDV